MVNLRGIIITLLVAASLVVIGCGQAEPSDVSSGSNTDDGESPTQVESPQAELVKIPFIQGGEALTWMPIYLARGLGFLEEEGIELEMSYLPNAAGVAQGVLSNEYSMGALGTNAIWAAAVQGRDIKLFASLANQPTMSLTLRNDTINQLAEKGVTIDSPIEERIEALRGLELAMAPAGSTTDTFIRYTLRAYGLDPDKDLVINPIGDQAALVAATREGRVAGLVFSSPTSDIPVAEGWGQIWISWSRGDVPRLRGVSFVGVAAREPWLEENRELAVRFTRALWRATDVLQNDPETARDVMRSFFPDMEENLFNAAFESVRPAFLAGPLLQESEFQLSFDLWADGLDPKPEPVAFEDAVDTAIARDARP